MSGWELRNFVPETKTDFNAQKRKRKTANSVHFLIFMFFIQFRVPIHSVFNFTALSVSRKSQFRAKPHFTEAWASIQSGSDTGHI